MDVQVSGDELAVLWLQKTYIQIEWIEIETMASKYLWSLTTFGWVEDLESDDQQKHDAQEMYSCDAPDNSTCIKIGLTAQNV